MTLFTKILLAVIVALAATLTYSNFRYQRMSTAYEAQKQASIAALEAVDAAIEAVKRAEEQRQLAYTVLSQTEDELASIRLENRDLEEKILSASADQDGDVAPILEAVRLQKFGGQK